MYLYVTPNFYLSTAKRKGFTCISDLFVNLPSLDIENNFMVYLVIESFYNKLGKNISVIESNRVTKPADNDEDMKLFLTNIGLTESFINSEYKSLRDKYYTYYNKIKLGYEIYDKFCEIKNVNNTTEEYSIEEVEYYKYEVVNSKGETVATCDSYREASETIEELKNK